MKSKISPMSASTREVSGIAALSEHDGEIKLRRMPNLIYKVHFEGASPLITHRFVADDPTSKAKKLKLKPEEEAYRGLYLNGKGQCCLESHMVYACLVQAGTHVQGMKKARYTAKRDIAAGIEVKSLDANDPVNIPILINGKSTLASAHDYETFTAPAKNSGSGGTVPRSRPRFYNWSIDFLVVLDPELLDKETLVQTADIAGRRCGVGDNRPSSPNKPGLHGKFQITSITQI